MEAKAAMMRSRRSSAARCRSASTSRSPVMPSGGSANPSLLQRFRGKLGAVGNLRFLEQLPDVKLDGVLAEMQLLGRVAIAGSIHDQLQDLALTLTPCRRRGAVRRLRVAGSPQRVVSGGVVISHGRQRSHCVKESQPLLVGLEHHPAEDLDRAYK